MKPDTEEKIRQAFSRYPRKTYSKGQMIVFRSENPNFLYYLVRGKVRKYDINYRADEIAVNIMKPPSFLPMVHVVNQTPNSYYYRAETICEVHVVPIEEALSFFKSDTEILFGMLSRIYGLVDRLQGRIVQLMAGTAQSRLIYELVVECRRFGKPNQDGTHTVEVSLLDLAARSGLSRETISRELQKLKQQQLVTINKQCITIHNFMNLEKKLDVSLANESLI